MADDPGQELADLEEEMEDRHSSYWQGPQAAVKQERALELYSAEEAMVPAPPRVRERRLSEIEAAMASRDGEYWHDQAMRDEYLHLLEGEDAGAAEAGDAPLEAVVALALDLGLPEDEANAIVAELSVLGVNDGEAAAGARRMDGAVASSVEGQLAHSPVVTPCTFVLSVGSAAIVPGKKPNY